MQSRFSRQGAGFILADIFDKAIASRTSAFPNVVRGRTILLTADYSGGHREQIFDTYSFLILDLDQNDRWLQWQRQFRSNVMPLRRRIAFKALNDRARRRALIPFLQMAHGIHGFLATFAVSKARGPHVSLFEADIESSDAEVSAFRKIWKPAIFERVMRVVHLSAFLLSGLSIAGQNLIWITDEDAIASNDEQLTLLARLFARVWSNCNAHDLGRIHCGTTKSDDGSLALEDLAAIPDLVAGAVSEVGFAMLQQERLPIRGISVPIPSDLTWKTRTILSWLAYEASSLQHLTCFIELNSSSPGMRVTHVRWDALPSWFIS